MAVYPGNMLVLHMSKPQGFGYRSGQYILLNCVSPFEWHPFSITSAPGDDYLSVHIRILDDWTRSLKVKFSKYCHPPNNGNGELLRTECMQEDGSRSAPPKILIEGPYGAPAQGYKQYEVMLLVGLGFGAIPLINRILKDTVNNMKALEEEEGTNVEDGASGFFGKSPSTFPHKKNGSSDSRTRRVYFYWVTREKSSYEWFKDVMNDVAEQDHRGVIELHNYFTGVYFEKGYLVLTAMLMLQSLDHANGVDIMSGTRVITHFGRPDWRTVFKRVAVAHPRARVGVFYCGTPMLTEELRQLASDFSHNTTTKYDFHKENFYY